MTIKGKCNRISLFLYDCLYDRNYKMKINNYCPYPPKIVFRHIKNKEKVVYTPKINEQK